jgi:hypothetical protein
MNYQGIYGPVEALTYLNSSTYVQATPNSVAMTLQSGACPTGASGDSGGCQYYAGWAGTNFGSTQYAVPPGQLALGVWHELVCHVHYATDSSGVYECWHRVKGATSWTLTGRYSGVPTVQWAIGSSPALPSQDLDKVGAYRQPASWPLTQYEDSFCVATSFASAESCF